MTQTQNSKPEINILLTEYMIIVVDKITLAKHEPIGCLYQNFVSFTTPTGTN